MRVDGRTSHHGHITATCDNGDDVLSMMTVFRNVVTRPLRMGPFESEKNIIVFELF